MRTLAIDDVRPCEEANVVARNYQDGIDALTLLRPFQVLLLDHDLGYESISPATGRELSGYDVCVFLETHPEYRPNEVWLISANPVGVQRMAQVLERLYDVVSPDRRFFAQPRVISQP